jgi:hypothetical protein
MVCGYLKLWELWRNDEEERTTETYV